MHYILHISPLYLLNDAYIPRKPTDEAYGTVTMLAVHTAHGKSNTV